MICVSLTTSNPHDIYIANKYSDIIEIRADLIKKLDLQYIISKLKKPIIVTFRGDSKRKFSILKQAISLNSDYIDVDCDSKYLTSLLKLRHKTKIIISYHNHLKTPDNLFTIYKKIRTLSPDLIKIVTYANSINDPLKIFDLLKKTYWFSANKCFRSRNLHVFRRPKTFERSPRGDTRIPLNSECATARAETRSVLNKYKKTRSPKLIAFCMGDYGEISRILNFGSYLTFACLEEGKGSAPGQIPLKTLKEVYRYNQLKNPKIYGVVGNPVNKSKGYIIHNKAFSRLNLNNLYLNFSVDNLSLFIKNYSHLISGLSITMPFKQQIINSLDKLDPAARKICAVNTVAIKNKKLIGYNTDYTGALKALTRKTTIKNKKVLLLGAGGAARAISFAVMQNKGKLLIYNRTVSKAKKLARQFHCEYCTYNQLNSLRNIDIIINATSIGMSPEVNKTPINKSQLKKIIHRHTVVFDVVYNPPKTKLLKDAAQLGCTTISGVEMFIHLSAEQFKLWTGKSLPITLIRKTVLANLK